MSSRLTMIPPKNNLFSDLFQEEYAEGDSVVKTHCRPFVIDAYRLISGKME